MTNTRHLALLADGSSDRALLPVLTWLVRELAPMATFAEPSFTVRDTRRPLAAEVERVVALHRPDLTFVHRDAENVPPAERRREIPRAIGIVPVVPVRMTEAWLLLDEATIRRAADRPNGREPLDLPPLARLESLADPKQRLHELLLTAAAVTGRQRKRFVAGLSLRVQRTAELLTDFRPLRRLTAFQQLEAECPEAVAGWQAPSV